MGISPIEYKPWKKERTGYRKRVLAISNYIFRSKTGSPWILVILIIGLFLTMLGPLFTAVLIPHEEFTKDMMIDSEDTTDEDLIEVGTFYVNGKISIHGTLTLLGQLDINGEISGNGAYTSSTGILGVSEFNITGSVDVNGAANIDGTISGNGTIYGFGYIDGTGTLTGDWSGENTVFDEISKEIENYKQNNEIWDKDHNGDNSDQKDDGSDNVIDLLYSKSEMEISDTLDSNGTFVVNGNISIDGDLFIDGLFYLNGTVVGKGTFENQDMIVETGDLNVTGSVIVDRNVEINGIVSGEGFIYGFGFFNGSGNISGNLSYESLNLLLDEIQNKDQDDDPIASTNIMYVDGPIDVDGSFLVDGDVFINGSIFINGTYIIFGNVSGNLVYSYNDSEKIHGWISVFGITDTDGTVILDGNFSGSGVIIGTGYLNGTGSVHGFFEFNVDDLKVEEKIKSEMLLETLENEMDAINVEEFTEGFFENGLFIIFSLLLVSFICANLIASDLGDNSFVLYFSRSITPKDYIAGKFFGAFGAMALFCILGPLIVSIAAISTQSSNDYSGSLNVMGLTIIAGVLTTIFFLPLGLMISSFTKRPGYAGVGIFMTFFTLVIIGGIFSNFNAKWVLINPWEVLNLSYLGIYGRSLPSGITGPMVGAVLFSFIVIPLFIVYIRMQRKGAGK